MICAISPRTAPAETTCRSAAETRVGNSELASANNLTNLRIIWCPRCTESTPTLPKAAATYGECVEAQQYRREFDKTISMEIVRSALREVQDVLRAVQDRDCPLVALPWRGLRR